MIYCALAYASFALMYGAGFSGTCYVDHHDCAVAAAAVNHEADYLARATVERRINNLVTVEGASCLPQPAARLGKS